MANARAIPATPPTTPPTTDCWVGVRPVLLPPSPSESDPELEVAAASDVVDGDVEAAPTERNVGSGVEVARPSLKTVEKSDEVDGRSPNANVREALWEDVRLAVLVMAENGSVAMTLPLMRESSMVDVAVTVTVRSSVAVVVVPLIETRPLVLELLVYEVIVDESMNEELELVMVAESVGPPEMLVLLEMPGMVTEMAVLMEPMSVRETTEPVVAAGTSVTLEIVVPSFTLTSTTLAVTVASGARGNR
jgi:hypothetical protein